MIEGRSIGRLTVIKLDHRRQYKSGSKGYYLCQCSCGNEKVVRRDHLTSQTTRSCGCLEAENRERLAFKESHGQTKTKLYYVWNSMRMRCRNPNVKNYHNYGGRGIKVCDEWNESFEPFYKWAMASGYEEHLTIERIDNDGNYEPANCAWIPSEKQALNRRNTRVIEYRGRQYSMREISRKFGINYNTFRNYIRKGKTPEQIIQHFNKN